MSDDAYREALSAAHSRIAQLERTLAERGSVSAKAAKLAALHRERARVAVAAQPRSVGRFFATRVAAPLGIAAVVFASRWGVRGDWGFVAAAPAVVIAAWLVMRAFLRSARSDAAKQLALVDAEIASTEREVASEI